MAAERGNSKNNGQDEVKAFLGSSDTSAHQIAAGGTLQDPHSLTSGQINIPNENRGNTPLHILAYHYATQDQDEDEGEALRYRKVADQLIDLAVAGKFKFESLNNTKHYVLHILARQKRDREYVVLKELLNSVSKYISPERMYEIVNTLSVSSGSTAFFYAINTKNITAALTLLSYGANPCRYGKYNEIDGTAIPEERKRIPLNDIAKAHYSLKEVEQLAQGVEEEIKSLEKKMNDYTQSIGGLPKKYLKDYNRLPKRKSDADQEQIALFKLASLGASQACQRLQYFAQQQKPLKEFSIGLEKIINTKKAQLKAATSPKAVALPPLQLAAMKRKSAEDAAGSSGISTTYREFDTYPNAQHSIDHSNHRRFTK